MLGRLLGRAEPEQEQTVERSTISLSELGAMYQQQLPYSPVPVSVKNAMTHAASSACVDVLSSSVSQLPVDVVRYEGKVRRPVEPTPSLIASPSVMVEQDVWLYQLIESMATDGNAFGLVMSLDRMARPTQVELLEPGTVTERRVEDGVPQAKVAGKDVHKLYPHGDLFHIPGPFVHAGSPFGENVIDRARATIGAALAAREYGSRFFGDGGHPSSAIYSVDDLNLDQAKAIKAAFVNATRGNREPVVFGNSLKYEQLSTAPGESQFLELMQFCIEEACRFWRVPPSMVYAAVSGQSVTYANISQADLHYLKHSLERYLVRLERAMSKLLSRPQVVRFNRNAFLRADAETRHKVYDTRLRNKTMTVNEVRANEDEEPFSDPKYDEPSDLPAPAIPAPAQGGA